MTSNSLLEVAALSAGYEGVQALHDVAMSVAPGSITAIIGANGAGKTTLLRSISGSLRPMAGAVVMFQGRDIAGLRADRVVGRGLVMVPEGRRLFAPLSVRENLLLGGILRMRRGERRAVLADLDAVFAMFPRLLERSAQLAGTLSGGEQQMVAIGRALMARPVLLLLDEPSMGLAPRVVTDIFRVLRKLNRDGTTILLAEQNARMALRVADRAYVLETGRIVREGPAATLAVDPDVQRIYLGVADGQAARPAS